MRTRFLLEILMLLGSMTASFANMPTLTTKPSPPGLLACQAWAAKQDDDAIYMWGVQESGGTSHDLAISRLTGNCMGDEVPDIVGFGSSVGYDYHYCVNHPNVQICLQKGKQADATKDGARDIPRTPDKADVLIDKPGLVSDVSFCKDDLVLTPGTLVGNGCMHFNPLKVNVVGTSGSKLIVRFNVDDGPEMTMMADQDNTKLVCGSESVAVSAFLNGAAPVCASTAAPAAPTDAKDADTPIKALGAIITISPRDPKSDDCNVKGSIDFSLYVAKLPLLRKGYLNQDFSIDFYDQRERQVLAYVLLKREVALVTDAIYDGHDEGECHFSLSVNYSDKFGQDHNFEIVTWRFDRSIAAKVNWDKVDVTKFDTIALDYRLSPKVQDWIADEPKDDGPKGSTPNTPAVADCDIFLFNANAIFTRAVAFCRKDYMDSRAGLAALEGARKCSMSEAEFREKARTGIGIFDKVMREHGRRTACQFTEAVSQQINSKLR